MEPHKNTAYCSEKNLESNSLHNNSCTATYLPSHKPSKYDKQNMLVSKAKLISNILWWTPTYGHTSVGQPGTTYFQLLCADTRSYL